MLVWGNSAEALQVLQLPYVSSGAPRSIVRRHAKPGRSAEESAAEQTELAPLTHRTGLGF